MVHPDGWSDKGLGGYILLAKQYYLNGQWNQLEEIVQSLANLLAETTESREDMHGQSGVPINGLSELSMLPWKFEKNIYRMIRNSVDIYVDFHPVPLGYYILASLALRRGDCGQHEECTCEMERK